MLNLAKSLALVEDINGTHSHPLLGSGAHRLGAVTDPLSKLIETTEQNRNLVNQLLDGQSPVWRSSANEEVRASGTGDRINFGRKLAGCDTCRHLVGLGPPVINLFGTEGDGPDRIISQMDRLDGKRAGEAPFTS